MFTQEEVQVLMQAQTAFGAEPTVPNGILVPSEGAFVPKHARNKIENPQKFSDGIRRKFALGNHTTTASGSFTPNLDYVGHLLKALCTTLSTSGAGPYIHVGKLATGDVLFHLIEKGVVGQALWRRYLDMVLQSFSLNLPIEGMLTTDTNWVGSGTMTKSATPFDATPTEVTGDPAEYADITLQMDGVDTTDVTDVTINIEKSIVEKRVHNGLGKATQLRAGEINVTGTINAFFETEATAAKAEAKTLAALKATLVAGTASLETLLPEIQLEVSDWERSDNGVIVSFNFESVKSVSADSPAKFTLTNGVATY